MLSPKPGRHEALSAQPVVDDDDYWDSFESLRPQKGKLRSSFITRPGGNAILQETFFDTYVQPCLAEFIGTMMLVFVGAMVVRTDNILAIAAGHGFILAAICAAFGGISGAHVNPAVTLGSLIAGTIGEIMSVLYFVCQLFGGILGALLVRVCLDYTPRQGTEVGIKTVYENIGGGGPSVTGGLTLFAAMLTEAELTFMLVLVVLMSTARERDTTLAPVAIGLTLAACIIAGASSTGAALNPIRAFGPAVANWGIPNTWNHHWVYWLGPMLGGAIAGLLFKTLMGPYSMRLFC